MLAKIYFKFFSWYISSIIKKDFASFSFDKFEVAKDKSILLLSNHFSWWDGFLMFDLNKRFFKRKFHVLVSEENYNKVKFLKYLGAFPIKPQSRDSINALNFAASLLEDPTNLVLIFPQGQLCSNHLDELTFEKGVARIAKSVKGDFQYVYAASFVDYFENRKPGIACYLKASDPEKVTDFSTLVLEYNEHYRNSRQIQSRITV